MNKRKIITRTKNIEKIYSKSIKFLGPGIVAKNNYFVLSLHPSQLSLRFCLSVCLLGQVFD